MHVSEGLADRTPVVVAVRRTAFGKVTGIHLSLRADELLAPVLKELAVGVVPNDVIIGNAIGAGGNLARLAALRAGLGNEVPGVTVDRQCGSGLEAIIQACRLIQAGAGSAYLAGGVESISTAPGRANRTADGSWEFFTRARFSPDELGDPDMGVGQKTLLLTFRSLGNAKTPSLNVVIYAHWRAKRQASLLTRLLATIRTNARAEASRPRS